MLMRQFACATMVALGLLAGAAHAADTPPAEYTLTEENDSIFGDQDRHYTQGIMLTRTATPAAGGFWDGLDAGFGQLAGFLGAGPAVARRYQFPILGQNIYTPENIEASVPDPDDRPYAGWLYIGAGLRQRDASGRTDRLQVLIGVVGPWALAEEAQNGFHKIFGFSKAEGYDHDQLHNEPALLIGYQAIWDQSLFQLGPIESDVLPELGVTLGNVLTYGEAGLTLRVGQGLAAGGTPRTITPGLSGADDFDPGRLDGPFGWMAFGGVQTRAVWRDLFLDGNSFRSSPSVAKRNIVTDLDFGVSLLFRFGLRVDVTFVDRGREFSNQVSNDHFASISLSTPF
jgi:hypothetical protein